MYSYRKLVKLLKENGFERIRTNGSHEIYYSEETNATVTVANNKKDIPKGTYNRILSDAGLK